MKPALTKTARRLLFAAALPAIAATGARAQRIEFYKAGYCAPNSSAHSIARGWDNNFFVAGAARTRSAGGAMSSDLMLIKMKPDGDTLWNRTYGDSFRHETGFCVLTPQSDEVMVAGVIGDTGSAPGSTAFLASFNAAGVPAWQKTYPIPGKRTVVVDMKRLNDGFILCGAITDSITNDTDAWLLKTDLAGNKLWSNSYGGQAYDNAWQVERTPDGGFMLGGGSHSFRSGSRQNDAWLVKTTGTGAEVWNKNYGNADTIDWIWSMAPVGNASAPKGYIFTGVRNYDPGGGGSEMFLARVDTAGAIVWDKPLRGGFGYLEGMSVEPTLHNTFYVAGTELDATGSYTLLAMDVDSGGTVLNRVRYSSPSLAWISPRSVYINNFLDAYIVGQQFTPDDAIRAFAARIRDIDQVPVPASARATLAPAAISVFPNPATGSCTVTSEGEDMRRIMLRDATGRTVLQIPAPGARYETISLKGLPPGRYVVTVYTGGIAPVNLPLTVR